MQGEANILILPSLDAANILFNVLKVVGGHGVTVGPILLGAAQPVHILTPSATMRRVVNMTALAAAGRRGAARRLNPGRETRGREPLPCSAPRGGTGPEERAIEDVSRDQQRRIGLAGVALRGIQPLAEGDRALQPEQPLRVMAVQWGTARPHAIRLSC